MHRTSSTMKRSTSANLGSFPVWPSRGPGLQGRDLCAHTHWRHSRGPTPAASLATCPPHAGRSLAGLVTCLCMQDAPWQAWSHTTACSPLLATSLVACHCVQDAPCGTSLGHMPLHAGRSLAVPRLVRCKARRTPPVAPASSPTQPLLARTASPSAMHRPPANAASTQHQPLLGNL